MKAIRSMGMGSGIILAVIGFILFVFPALSMSLFAVLVGCGILIVGLSTTLMWFRTMRGTGKGTAVLITGVLAILFGLFCILNPLVFASSMTWLVALVIVIFGIAQIITIVTTPNVNGKFIGIGGNLIVTLFGVLALIWPPFIMQFIGVSLLIEGITVIIMSLSTPSA